LKSEPVLILSSGRARFFGLGGPVDRAHTGKQMEEELLALLAELRSATDQVKEKMNAFATVGNRWVETADTLMKQQDLLGLVQVYRDHSEEPHGLDQPFVWYVEVELGGGEVVEYGELFRRLGGLVDELGTMGTSA
jgi:hypothetical protein